MLKHLTSYSLIALLSSCSQRSDESPTPSDAPMQSSPARSAPSAGGRVSDDPSRIGAGAGGRVGVAPARPSAGAAGPAGAEASAAGSVNTAGHAGSSPQNGSAGSTDDDAGSDTPPIPDAGAQTDPDESSTGPFPTLTSFAADGPYRSVELGNTGPNNNFTIYHPSELAPGGAKNPILVWMNGGSSVPAIYSLLPLLATQGFVVLASNTPPGIGEEIALGQEMVAAIDWAFAEQERSGSVFMGKLDTSKVGAFGYSMGSLATFTMANDPRLSTTIHISGGNMVTDRIKNLHAPAAFLCGIAKPDCSDIFAEDCDIAGANCATDFEAATTSVFYGVYAYGHTGILVPPYQERIHTEVAAWFRWQLMQDRTLRARFAGPSCGVCSDPSWTVQRKGDLL